MNVKQLMLEGIAIKLQTNVVNNNYRTFYYIGIIFKMFCASSSERNTPGNAPPTPAANTAKVESLHTKSEHTHTIQIKINYF